MKTLITYLIFPGFLFSVCAGLFAGWIDRKVSARLQWRKGPPWHQNFTDILKLLGKENIVPAGSRTVFLLSPWIGLSSVVLAAVILGKSILMPLDSFVGDLIVALYLLTMPAIAVILGASASANPLASVGASREMKLVFGYELPFLIAVLTAVIKSAGALQLGQIINHQINFGSNIWSFSGAVAFLVALICTQAKLGLAPFEIAEAEQEIMAGVFIEYSGPALAVFKMMKALVLYTMFLLLIVLFLGKDITPLFLFIKFIAILLAVIIIKNTNPRLRIDQALKFLWGPVTVLAVIALGLALLGY